MPFKMGAGFIGRQYIMSLACNWFYMGGYAGYIWPAYAAVFFVFITHFLHTKWQKKRVFRMLARWYKKV